METLRLKSRQPVEEDIENWDDGDFMMMDSDDLTLARSNPTTSRPPSRRRDSGSSHFSLRSDLESWAEEEDTQVHIPGDDEKSTLDAISAAQNAGIPLPKNVPSSALMGGTIKRLGGRQIRKIIHEDWENDMEIPDAAQGLRIKSPDQFEFPTTLRQVSVGSIQVKSLTIKSPTINFPCDLTESVTSINSHSTAVNLDRFKDDDDDDFFGNGGDTIKVSKQRQPIKPLSLITPPTPSKHVKANDPEDDFEKDLELPSHGKLQLSSRRDIPKTPNMSQSDDIDWGEGSLGTRYGGTRRDGVRSARSSSASALTPLSPSISSSITAESEDETFDGLVLPPGPVNFQERLQKRRKSQSPECMPEQPVSPAKKTPPAEADKLDFLEGLDIGDGDVFNSGKLTLHRNIKVKETRTSSPVRPKTAISITFTNKPATSSRLPRLSHDRTHSTSLEPVSESGGPIPQRTRRPQSRLGHSAQSSVSSIPTPSTPSPSQRYSPSTPRTRELGTKTSTPSLRNEPTTTHAQLLKQKRSLPAIRAMNPPSKPSNFRYDRPPSRDRPQSAMRPKTPVEHYSRSTLAESPALYSRRTYQPFLPAGAANAQSQHVTTKTVRPFRRHDSDASIDSLRPSSRAYSRSTMRSPSPQVRYRVAADTWERLSKPKNKKHFGDGHELDGFDDLPTSRETETRFLKHAVSTSSKTSLRKAYNTIVPDRTSTPTPSLIAKPTSTPHFARDTAASRIARETILAHRTTASQSGPLAPVTAQRGALLSSRNNLNVQHSSARPKRTTKRAPQLKPHLISNLSGGKESKSKQTIVLLKSL